MKRAAPLALSVWLRHVRRVYPNGVVAVEGVSLEVPAGQFVALLGPSGCGKSTLLRMIAGLDQPSSGQVSVVRNEANWVERTRNEPNLGIAAETAVPRGMENGTKPIGDAGARNEPNLEVGITAGPAGLPHGMDGTKPILGVSGRNEPNSGEAAAGAERSQFPASTGGSSAPAARRNEANLAVNGDRDVAYVFQDAHLLPWRTVLDNAALPLEFRNEPKSARHARAAAVLSQLGLGEALGRYPAQLSGGMRMRVSLARALVTDPKLLLLDEPFAALDEITRQRLDEMLRALWRERGMTVLFVTHSIAEAVFLAERAVVFSRRPARVILDQPIDLPLDRTAELRSEARFAGQLRSLHQALAAEEVEDA